METLLFLYTVIHTCQGQGHIGIETRFLPYRHYIASVTLLMGTNRIKSQSC